MLTAFSSSEAVSQCVCGKQQRLKFKSAGEFTNTFKSQTIAPFQTLSSERGLGRLTHSPPWCQPSKGISGCLQGAFSSLLSPWQEWGQGCLQHRGAVGLAWGLGIVWILFPRQWGGLPGDPWWLCHSIGNPTGLQNSLHFPSCLETLKEKVLFSSSFSQTCLQGVSGKHSGVWNQCWLKVKSKAKNLVLCSL